MAAPLGVVWAGKELFDGATKALALFISVTYIIGLIVVNSYLNSLGIRAPSLISVEYISAGLPPAVLFLVAGLTGAFLDRPTQPRRTKFAVLGLALVLLALIMLYLTNLVDYPKTLRTTGLIFGLLVLMAYGIVRHVRRQVLASREQIIVWSGIYGLVLLILLVSLSSFYGRTVYDDILTTVGGGAGVTISFVTDAASRPVLQMLVPMAGDLQTVPVRLIRETGDGYLVTTGETSVTVGKALVKGVIHHRVQGWQVKPSIFD